jgi:hypothetical protein
MTSPIIRLRNQPVATPVRAVQKPADSHAAPSSVARPDSNDIRPPSSAPGGVTAAGLNPAVSPEQQRATFERLFQLGRERALLGESPVLVLDHRLTAIDDRPITRKGFEQLVRAHGVDELKNLDEAMANGTLKFLPGYTEQASDHWRQEHAELVQKYPAAFGAPGSRLDIDFMSFSVRDSHAAEGLATLVARWNVETMGRGKVIFAGAGTGTKEDFEAVYSRPVAEGGGGIANPDVRFGAPSVKDDDANNRAQAKVDAYNATHRNEPPVQLDRDSRGKAGWIETIEREPAPNGLPQVVVGFIDDRAHNRMAAQAAGKLGDRMITVRAVAPGLSFSQAEKDNPNAISTFKPLTRQDLVWDGRDAAPIHERITHRVV